MSQNSRIWLKWSASERSQYLHQCSLLPTSTKPSSLLTLDGQFIMDHTSFLCELGHAFWGSDGFCGHSLAQAQSILCTHTPTPQKIIWQDADVSMENMGEAAFYECLSVLQNTLIEGVLLYRMPRYFK